MNRDGCVYGEALYGLAREEGLDDIILEQLGVLDRSFAREPGFLKVLSARTLTRQERREIVDRCFRGRIHAYVCSTLKLLMEKDRIRRFPECVDAYRKRYNEDHGILRVTAVTAAALTDAQRGRLRERLARMTGKTIDLTVRVDPSCMGGVRLDHDGRRLDGTVARRLDAVRELLQNTGL